MRRKMIPPLPNADESTSVRFRRFAKAVLAVPKTEIETPEQVIARLQAEKRKIEKMIAAINQETAKRKMKEATPKGRL